MICVFLLQPLRTMKHILDLLLLNLKERSDELPKIDQSHPANNINSDGKISSNNANFASVMGSINEDGEVNKEESSNGEVLEMDREPMDDKTPTERLWI